MEFNVSNCSQCPLFNWDGENGLWECKALKKNIEALGIPSESEFHPDHSIVFEECPLKQNVIIIQLKKHQS